LINPRPPCLTGKAASVQHSTMIQERRTVEGIGQVLKEGIGANSEPSHEMRVTTRGQEENRVRQTAISEDAAGNLELNNVEINPTTHSRVGQHVLEVVGNESDVMRAMAELESSMYKNKE
jgi:hypothetical protein